jgi:hypothetical protein
MDTAAELRGEAARLRGFVGRVTDPAEFGPSVCEGQHVPTIIHSPVLSLAQKTLPEQPSPIVTDRAGMSCTMNVPTFSERNR